MKRGVMLFEDGKPLEHGEPELIQAVGTMMKRRRLVLQDGNKLITEFKTEEEVKAALFLVDGLPILRFEG